MATEKVKEVEGKRHVIIGIYLCDSYDLWKQQKNAYFSQSQETADSTSHGTDEEFARHLLAVHAKFCTVPSCARDETTRPAESSRPARALTLALGGPGLALSPASRLNNSTFALSVSSSSRHENVTELTTGDSDSTILALPAPKDGHCVKINVSIETEPCGTSQAQDGLSDATHHGHGSDELTLQNQDGAEPEECFTETIERETDSENANETESCGTSQAQDGLGDAPRHGSHELTQQNQDGAGPEEGFTIIKIEPDLENTDEIAEHQLGEPHNSLQGMETLPNTTKKKSTVCSTDSTATMSAAALTLPKSSGNPSPSSPLQKCQVCHKILRKKKLAAPASQGIPLRCDVCHCQRDDARTGGSPRVRNSAADAGKPKIDKGTRRASTSADEAHLRGGRTVGGESNARSVSHSAFRTRSHLAQPKCPKCSRAFSCKSKLTRHLNAQTCVLRSYKCDTCSKVFSSKRCLVYHVRTHTGDRPYECSVCPKKYDSPSILNYHMRVHTGETPYKCGTCSEEFRMKKQLNAHVLKKHTLRERVHQCPLCPKAFLDKQHLNRHTKDIHYAGTPHRCHLCPKAFRLKLRLTEHLAANHRPSEKVHKCNICKGIFSGEDQLNNHLKRAHSGIKVHVPFRPTVEARYREHSYNKVITK